MNASSLRLLGPLACVLLGACQGGDSDSTDAPAAASAPTSVPAGEAKLAPLPGKEGAVPQLTETTTVRLATTGGRRRRSRSIRKPRRTRRNVSSSS